MCHSDLPEKCKRFSQWRKLGIEPSISNWWFEQWATILLSLLERRSRRILTEKQEKYLLWFHQLFIFLDCNAFWASPQLHFVSRWSFRSATPWNVMIWSNTRFTWQLRLVFMACPTMAVRIQQINHSILSIEREVGINYLTRIWIKIVYIWQKNGENATTIGSNVKYFMIHQQSARE